MFVDRAKITIKSGKGGNGAVTFRREPFVPEGGPDGGDGGKGGDVVFIADENLRTLMDFRYKRKYEAESGQNGMKKKRFGKNGEDLIIKVPVGTMVIDEASGKIMADEKNIDGGRAIRVKRPDPSAEEIWTLKVPRLREDAADSAQKARAGNKTKRKEDAADKHSLHKAVGQAERAEKPEDAREEIDDTQIERIAGKVIP